MVLRKEHCVLGLGEIKRDLITGTWASVRNLSCGSSRPICGRREVMCWQWQSHLWGFCELAYAQRGFETLPAFEVSPAFSISYSKHGAILGFQPCIPNKHLAQKYPGVFSSSSPSANWKGGGGRLDHGGGKLHLSSIQKGVKKEHCQNLTKCNMNRCSPEVVCDAWNEIHLFLVPCIGWRKLLLHQGFLFAAGSLVLQCQVYVL